MLRARQKRTHSANIDNGPVCSVLQGVAVCCSQNSSALRTTKTPTHRHHPHWPVRSVLQRVAVYCCVLQSEFQCSARGKNAHTAPSSLMGLCVVCCSALQ